MDREGVRPGAVVTVSGLDGHFKVISADKIKSATKFELLSLSNNKILIILSPPYELNEVLPPFRLAMEKKFDRPERFDLFVESNRLSLIYLWDPIASISTTQIDVLPHQVEAVYRMLQEFHPRFLLADDAGLGKTIMAGMMLKELKLRKRADRVLIVVPAALQYQWKRELLERFCEKFTIFDTAYISSHYEDSPWINPWTDQNHVITSMDYAKREDILDLLRETRWNLTIIDEAHKLTAHRFGAKEFRTKRYTLGRALANISDALLFLTATPHSGDSFTFYKFISLIDPFLFASMHQINKEKVRRIMIRRLKEDCRNFNGESLFPPREPKTIPVKFSGEENELYKKVIEYVRYYFNLAKTEQNRGVSFAMTILQKRMASSIYAIKRSLFNRLERLKSLREVGLRLEQLSREQAEQRELLRELSLEGLSTEDLSEDEREDLEKRFEVLTMARNTEELNEEISHLEQLAKLSESVATDSKLEELIKFTKEIHRLDPKEKILIFTEYRDTLEFLRDRLSKEGYEVALIHGGMKPEDRVSQEEYFAREDIKIMVATDAAGEGLNLQFAHIMVNYELPWNPNKLEQRIGRLHRYLQKKKVYVYNVLVEDTIEGEIFERLLDKIDAIKREMGDRIFDVLGILLAGVKLEDLVMEAIGKRAEWVALKMQEAEEVIEQRKHFILKEIEEKSLIRDSLDLSSVKELLGASVEVSINESDLERYVRKFFSLFGGEITDVFDSGTYEISLPSTLDKDKEISDSLYRILVWKRNDSNAKSYIPPVTFSKEIWKEKDPDVRFVALGHPLINRMLEICLDRSFGGRTTVKLDQRERKGVLYVFKGRILTSKGQTRGEKLFALFYDEENQTFQEVDPRCIWSFEEPPTSLNLTNVSVTPIKASYIEAESLLSKHLDSFLDDVQKKVAHDIEIRKEDMKKYYDFRIKKMQERIAASKAMLSAKAKARIMKRRESQLERIVKEMEHNISELEKERLLVSEGPELIALALIIPKETRTFEPRGSGQSVREVERAGIEHVLEHEKNCGRIPHDVSMEFRGYDISSENSQERRFIEVKSFLSSGALEITSHEWLVGEKLQSNYWLYIVEFALDKEQKRLWCIQNPSKVLKETAERKQILQFKVIVDKWKEFASPT